MSEPVNKGLRSEKNVKEKNEQHMKENGVPLVLTYNPNFNNLYFLICKNLQFLYADLKTKRIITPASFVSLKMKR